MLQKVCRRFRTTPHTLTLLWTPTKRQNFNHFSAKDFDCQTIYTPSASMFLSRKHTQTLIQPMAQP